MSAIGGHHSAASGTDVWLTPPSILEALGGASSFDLDPCAPQDRPWDMAKQHYTVDDDGLIRPWFGRVWMNPPYSRVLVDQFMAKMATHDCGTALIFARTETATFHRFVWERATGVLFLKGRLHFHFPDGQRAPANAGAPSVLIAYGHEDRDILAAAAIEGQFIPLRLPVSMLVEAVAPTWREALAEFFAEHDGKPVRLDDLYRAFAGHPKAKRNPNWQAKIRQTLQKGFEPVERGVWKPAQGELL